MLLNKLFYLSSLNNEVKHLNTKLGIKLQFFTPFEY